MPPEHCHLRAALGDFDGKDVRLLRKLVQASEFDRASIGSLLSLIEDEEVNVQIGASWLIRYATELHALVGERERRRVLEMLSWDTDWQVTLHLLQLFPFLSLGRGEAQETLPVLERLSEHERPFVRAWACNALYLVADSESSLRPHVNERLVRALNDGKSSVRARVRNVVRDSSWFQSTEQYGGPDAGR